MIRNGMIRGANSQAVESTLNNPSNTSKENTVTIFGDSFVSSHRDSTTQSNTINSAYASSCFAFLIGNLGDAINVTQFAGVIGDTADGMLARLQADVLVHKTDWVFMSVGPNDFYGFSRSAEAVFTDVKSISDQIIANGQKLMLLNSYPQGFGRGNYSFARTLALCDYNILLDDYAKTKDGLILVDVHSKAILQSDATNAAARPNYYIGLDDIHLNIFGAHDTGRLCEEALAPHIVRSDNQANMNPFRGGDYGDINLSNFNGSGGTAGTGMSGTVATGWVIGRNSGSGTMVGSHNAAGDYELAITKASAETSLFRIQTTELKGLFSGGESVKSRLVFSVDTGLNLEETRCYFYNDNGVDPFFTVDWGRSINGYTAEPVPIDNIVVDLPAVTILDTPLVNVIYFIDIRMKGTGTGIVTLKHLRINDA